MGILHGTGVAFRFCGGSGRAPISDGNGGIVEAVNVTEISGVAWLLRNTNPCEEKYVRI